MDSSVENPGWWAQSVAVAYEQDTGRRVKGQVADGTFEVSATRTLPGTMDEVFESWLAHSQGLTEIGGTQIADGPRETGTAKRRHWRIDLADGTRAAVSAEGKGEGKAFLTATHRSHLTHGAGIYSSCVGTSVKRRARRGWTVGIMHTRTRVATSLL